jgi:hypothetical protein
MNHLRTSEGSSLTGLKSCPLVDARDRKEVKKLITSGKRLEAV